MRAFGVVELQRASQRLQDAVGAWVSTSPGPRWPPGTTSSPPGRNPDTVRSAVGEHDTLFVTELDITDARSAERAVAAAVERFGRIDVLVNNGGKLLRRFLRGALAAAGPRPDRDQPLRPDERDPCRAAGHAQAALRLGDLDLLHGGGGRRRVRVGLRGVQVRPGGLDGARAAARQ